MSSAGITGRHDACDTHVLQLVKPGCASAAVGTGKHCAMESPDAGSEWNDAENLEHTEEEIDDQFRALLEGLRTTIPGVMVLFSFLLILPLQASFADLSGVNTVVFYVAFASAALASVLLISPSVHQRVRAPISGIKRKSWGHVLYATKLAIVGTVFFLVAISAVVFLVSSLVITDPFAIAATVVITTIAAWAWFFVPLVTFRRVRD